MNKLKTISFIKTTMMLCIVLYHSMLFFSNEWFIYASPKISAEYLNIISKIFNTFHVQTFTMASGFLFFYLLNENGKYKDTKEFLKKKAKRLILPYIITCIFWVIPFYIFFWDTDIKTIISKYILMTNPSQLWFLIMLFNIFIIFYIMKKHLKFNLKTLIIVFIISTVIGYSLSHFNINFFQISTSIKYSFYFYLGGFIYKNKEKINLKNIVLCIILSLSTIGITYFVCNIFNITKIYHLLTPLISGIEIIIIYYLSSKIVNKNQTKNKLYKILEENSFGIYLFHQQIIYLTIIIFNGIIHPIIQVILSFTISIIISLLICYLLKKNKMTKILFGL